MGEYLMSVIGAALIGGVVTAALPDSGGGGALKKYVGLIASLCVLCIIIAPAMNALGAVSDFFDGGLDGWLEEHEQDYEDKYYGYLASYGRDNAEEGIRDLICEEFSIEPENCHVSAEVSENDGKLRLDRIRVILSGSAIFKNPYEIEGYLGDLFECECIVGGGGING